MSFFPSPAIGPSSAILDSHGAVHHGQHYTGYLPLSWDRGSGAASWTRERERPIDSMRTIRLFSTHLLTPIFSAIA